ncbi:MAG: oxidoreductase [Pseudoduganella sp.]|jgi:NAD(P)-dependent dehydrogenase (short-subunit alcohol dehydrogenase family)|nr:oxidoreductase [Pseudoduganella sp.]
MEKVLIVTGASRGIGAAIARQAAADGWAVAVNYQRDAAAAAQVVAQIEAAGGRALAVQADVARDEDIERLFATVEGALGPVSGLVNNAGITGGLGSFADATPATIEQVFRINVLGLMQCSRRALAAFRAHGQGGVIVNISSTAATAGSPHEYVAYAASKAAVDTFTMGLGKEVAAQGIRVCGVAPGTTQTDIHASSGDAGRPARVAGRIPMLRVGEPEEIAEAAVWLLSPAARYITGTTLRVAGGA